MVTSSILPTARDNRPRSTLSALSEATRTLPAGYVHLGVAQEIPPTLRDFEIDPDPIIREAGLDPRLFDDGASIVSQVAVGRLLTLSVERTRCPHFGLLVGRRATLLSLGMVGRLMQHSETVGDALRVLVSNLSLQDPGTAPSLTVSGDTALFSFSVSRPEAESTDQISDGGLAVTVNLLRALCGSDWNPVEVLVPRTAPADREPYRRHFRAPVHFDQEVATLVLPARDLDRAVTGADPMLRAILADQIQQMKSSQGFEFLDDLRRLLRTRLTSNRCSAEDIADLLAMHQRTLSRRLKRSGMSYRAIVSEIRCEIARQLLDDTELPLTQIAAAWAIPRRARSPGPFGAGQARRQVPGATGGQTFLWPGPQWASPEASAFLFLGSSDRLRLEDRPPPAAPLKISSNSTLRTGSPEASKIYGFLLR